LHPHEVQEIRRRHREGESHASLAEAYQVSNRTISNCLRRVSWRYIPDKGPVPPNPRSLQREERLAKALEYAHEHGRVKAKTLCAEYPGWAPGMLDKDLKELVRRRLLVPVGRKRYCYYVPAKGRRAGTDARESLTRWVRDTGRNERCRLAGGTESV
jgi:hypothetical protein